MKLISHKQVHEEAIEKHGKVVVNGVTFTRGEDGRPTASNLSPRQVNLFQASPGFSIYHDDGSYSGPTGQARKLDNVEVATVRLSRDAEEAKTHRIIEGMMERGELTPGVLQALMERAPIITGKAPESTGTATTGTTQDASGTISVEVQGQVRTNAPEVKLVTATGGEMGTGNADSGPEQPEEGERKEVLQDDPTDYADPESIAKLPRAELFGLARSFGVEVKATARSKDIAEAIAEAFKQTPEYLAAQGGAPASEGDSTPDSGAQQ
ncbi:hypothetical protein Dgeo_3052 (plasmid) [Deinococcus geothermalis DSM 11300]|uniref:Uncharacterized protein n=1 Tax=Deinococcus geothermalis (strain DSM 11300 / CIP 105573 / AG-3a) TaxID=319795 RepID=A8ZRI4_DEIGD|nr:hypothetical protein [Deinococcus geothermalis]ABW35093.1 hypothetical protein Dgeo_3052 [Deinococcus geothermalis DSM 11300]